MADMGAVNVHNVTGEDVTVQEHDTFLTINVGENVSLFVKDVQTLSGIIMRLNAARSALRNGTNTLSLKRH